MGKTGRLHRTGRFAAYRHLAERGDLEAVVHLGDLAKTVTVRSGTQRIG